MSVLPGEGSFVILYGSTSFAARTRIHEGYLARPDVSGAFPVAVLLGPVGAGVKDLSRRLARRGIAAVGFEPHRSVDVGDIMRWLEAPGTPWADATRIGVVLLADDSVHGIGDAHSLVCLDTVPPATSKPVLGLYGADGAAASAARSLDLPGATWVFYGGADAGFWDIDGDAYHEAAAADAVERIAAFLGEIGSAEAA